MKGSQRLQTFKVHEYDREFPCPPPIGHESGEPIYKFEKILAHRGPENNSYYLVNWKGWPLDENLWEPDRYRQPSGIEYIIRIPESGWKHEYKESEK